MMVWSKTDSNNLSGTRSVSTLNPAQLARKRANDREAQRAIRARTKEHIERLEQQLADLQSERGGDQSQTIQELTRRNRALEEATRTPTRECMKLGIPENAEEKTGDTPETAELLRRIGGESLVLLKNENGVLPLKKNKKVGLAPAVHARHRRAPSSIQIFKLARS
ncbi:hypothetical protein BN1723_004235 [Verticillium longisporum]|uniref:BZIP domain-containing protein n=1 Tax=Verticillium longisporum TaxID=100787 RepID=A0A0G4MQ16_VERLO|nr:hypothetical protein BN1723_004235 [Verticillium longisporum]